LKQNQYVIDTKVMVCESENTSSDKKVCCLKQ